MQYCISHGFLRVVAKALSSGLDEILEQSQFLIDVSLKIVPGCADNTLH